jgi:hypothetical protein
MNAFFVGHSAVRNYLLLSNPRSKFSRTIMRVIKEWKKSKGGFLYYCRVTDMAVITGEEVEENPGAGKIELSCSYSEFLNQPSRYPASTCRELISMHFGKRVINEVQKLIEPKQK